MSNTKVPDGTCGLCERGVAGLVYLPQDLRVGATTTTVENVPMRECDVCGQHYFSRDVATTLEQIRLKPATSHKATAQLKFEFIDRELAA